VKAELVRIAAGGSAPTVPREAMAAFVSNRRCLDPSFVQE
jgi:hypothetical protein